MRPFKNTGSVQRLKSVENGFPYNGLENAHFPDLLTQKERIAKGGTIGTGGKGALALRFDDSHDAFNKNIFPILKSRGIPASMALISRFETAGHPWSQETTWDDVREWNRNGIEIWSHGTNHLDPTPDGYAGLYREIVESKNDIEKQGIKVAGWAKPGATAVSDEIPYGVPLTDINDYNSDTGRLLLKTYGLTEAYAHGVTRTLPYGLYHGLNHATMDFWSLEEAKESIKYHVVDRKFGYQIMMHTSNVGKEGSMSVGEYGEFIDYIYNLWNDGEIEVVTSSGLCFADASHSHRYDLIFGSRFEEWNISDEHTQIDEILSIPSNSSAFSNFIHNGLPSRGMSGESFVFEAEVRSDSGSVPEVRISDIGDSGRFQVSKTIGDVSPRSEAGEEWIKFRFVFRIHPNTRNLRISLRRYSGGEVEFRNVSVRNI